MSSEKKRPIGVLRFEIVGLDSATRDRWHSLANLIKRVTNCYWRSWLLTHVQADSVRRVQQYISDLQAWHKQGGKTDVPKCEVQCLTSEISSTIRAEIRSYYPEINSRCVELAVQVLGRRMFSMKSSKGAMPRWMRIVADDGELPSSSSPLPIPFDSGNSEIIVPLTDDDDFRLRVRLDRIERPEQKYATSTQDVCTLKTKTKSAASQTAILWQIANGEFQFSGSNLVYQESRDKWFAHIYYQAKKGSTPELVPERTAFLRPARLRPWWLRINGYHHYVGGRSGKPVAYVRQQLLTDRWSRQEAYQNASSARKGHGKDRAFGRLYKLQNRWKDFVKTSNHQLAQQVVAKCVESKCGKLIYFQPKGSIRESRFLHTAGKLPDRRDNSSWDWSQVQRILSYKCRQVGIKFEVRKIGEPVSHR